MGLLSRTVAIASALALASCSLLDDEEDYPPHFIFRCADGNGCGHADEDRIYGNGEVFGTVYMDREFEVYYGTVDASAWSADGSIDRYSIDAAEDVEVVAGSPYRLGSYQPFRASEPGLSVIIALNDADEVIDYMYIEAQPGPAVTHANTTDTETEPDADGGVDGGRLK